MESTTRQFTKAFDPTKEEHVLWLKNVGEAMKNAQPGGKKLDLEKLVNQNPFHERLDNFMDWAYAHFSIAMMYTDAVLSGTAFIPPKVHDTQDNN